MSLECSENLETRGNIKLKMFYIGRDDASKYEVEFSHFIGSPSLPPFIQLLNDANLTQV